jgi:hypothetical protein
MRIVRRVIDALDLALKPFLAWPSDDEWKAEMAAAKRAGAPAWMQHENVACALDGTEIKQGRPSKWDLQKHVYSAKHKQHSLNYLIVVLFTGAIVWVSSAHLKPHDQQHFNSSELRDLLRSSSVGVLADGGFNLNSVNGAYTPVDGAVPFKLPRRKKGNASVRTS